MIAPFLPQAGTSYITQSTASGHAPVRGLNKVSQTEAEGFRIKTFGLRLTGDMQSWRTDNVGQSDSGLTRTYSKEKEMDELWPLT